MSRTLELRGRLSARENKKNHTQYVVPYTTNLHIQVVYYILRSSLLVRQTVAKHPFQGYALHCYKQC